ncbi:hypothetical protein ECC01_21860 [Bacillus tequilensis]|nr:hypothetical protein [Bacillus tequilensis]
MIKSKDRSGSCTDRSKSRSRKDIVCYNCGEKGHYKNQCKQPKKNKKKGKEVESTESKDNTTTTVQGGDHGLPYRTVPPGTGGTYRSDRLSVRGPPLTVPVL